ncbi:MAG: N-acetyltransferase [Bacteroidetes bacterium]|nr:N-acetyltransferase [Bacteroidota bacterium]
MEKNDFFVHEKALCESNSIGKDTRIWAFAHIMKDVVIGEDCNIGSHVFVESGVKIGNRVTVKNGISIWDGITIEDDVFLGPNCVLTNDLLPRSKGYTENIKTLIKKGSSIGANATILCGITISEYSMIGAGSVVTKSVAPFSLVMGNPAKFRYFISLKGKRLEFDKDNITVDSENNKYIIRTDGVVRLEI